MHPMLMAELANDRHSELLRTAESRRNRTHSGGRRHLLADAADSLTRAMRRLPHPATAAVPVAADPCCA